MKVRELIEVLQSNDPEAEVLAWDPEADQEEPVIGVLQCRTSNIGPCVSLCTEPQDD